MRNTWKVLIVVVLVIAVAGILAGKRNGANTASPPSSSTSREMAAQPSTASSQTPATAPVKAAASPSPTQSAASPPATGAKPKPTQKPRQALPQMVELGSKTCVPCQMMQPILEELRKEYKGQLEVPFWDVYEHQDKAKAYGIRVIPTQVFIGADGKEFFRHEGFFPKEDILAKFKEHGIALRAAK
jgi:thioredoxin 1